MNEASSKYVDHIALKNLLDGKLSKVSHTTLGSRFMPEERVFSRLNQCIMQGFQKDMSRNLVEIPSCEATPFYPENNSIYLDTYPAENPRGNVLFLHGLFDDNKTNYNYQFKILNELGLNVYLMTMPYHYSRKPGESLFSGEYFLSADVYRSQNAFKQAVMDIDLSLQWMKSENPYPSILAGFSMGGCVAFRYHLLTHQTVSTFLINPVTDLSNIITDNPLMGKVRDDLQMSGAGPQLYKDLFRELDPCENLGDNFHADNLAMAYSNYDQIIDIGKYNTFISKTGIHQAVDFNCGHLNILRVPKLSMDMANFFESTSKRMRDQS